MTNDAYDWRVIEKELRQTQRDRQDTNKALEELRQNLLKAQRKTLIKDILWIVAIIGLFVVGTALCTYSIRNENEAGEVR